MTTTGLRERKKQRTREAIVREGMRLFGERGFDATTIADIAAASDIAPRTFFAYFPSKEAVVFDDFEEVYERFAERLRGRPRGESVFAALRSWVDTWVRSRDAFADTHQQRHRLIDATPALQSQYRANLARFEALIAEGVAADLDVPVDSLRARLVSAAAVAALDALRNAEGESHDVGDALRLMDEALVFLQAGLDGLLGHQPDPA